MDTDSFVDDDAIDQSNRVTNGNKSIELKAVR